MSIHGNFFIDPEFEKWRRITLYLREQKDREFISLSDLARDTNYFPNEIIDPLAAAGLSPVSENSYRISEILKALQKVSQHYSLASGFEHK
jgi:hypothetical protein